LSGSQNGNCTAFSELHTGTLHATSAGILLFYKKSLTLFCSIYQNGKKKEEAVKALVLISFSVTC
jgi:hypothetical protein